MIVTILGTIAIVIATVAIGIVIDKKIGFMPRPEELAGTEKKQLPGHAAGEAPATAIRASASQIAKLRASQRCPSCRAAMAVEPDDRVRYAERELVVLLFRCANCDAKRSLYIAPA